MPLELTQPWYLLGLLVLPVVGWYFHRGLTDFARWQRVASLSVRAVVLILLVGALCGLTWLKPSKDLYVVFVIDESLSEVNSGSKLVSETASKLATMLVGIRENAQDWKHA